MISSQIPQISFLFSKSALHRSSICLLELNLEDCLHSWAHMWSLIREVMRNAKMLEQLMGFLQTELAIPTESLDLARKTDTKDPNILSMILWQYGILTLEQLDQVFDWLEEAY